ncbi:ABC transporter substrate-binding protein [Pusillimonas sp.]|uniref:ABC transporter substrate-binding protein n=1 Tax=Pusillimonas sp. TaxID=3040095 RepID=UPI0037C8D397
MHIPTNSFSTVRGNFTSRFARFAQAIGISLALAAGASSAAHARDIQTAKGIVQVEGTPQRVVTLSESALDTALATGIQPVGTVATRGSNSVSEYLRARAGKIGIVGTAREYNLEAILALQPDLILAPQALSSDIYNKLSLMAPTIVPAASFSDDWRLMVSTYAQALGREEQVEEAYQGLDTRIGQLRERLGEPRTVSVVRWMPQGPMIMSSKVFTGQLLHALGFKTPELADKQGDRPHSDVLSLENLGGLDSDWLFLATLNKEGAETLEATKRQPAFTRLGAVREGNVSTVDGQIWSSATGVLAAGLILDDIEKTFLN